MPSQIMEEDLLRSIEEVEDRIKVFRKQVRAVLASVQTENPAEVTATAGEGTT